MKNKKKYFTLILSIVAILVVIFIGYQLFFTKSNLISLSYNEIVDKANNKESFVLCLSSTECSHCNSYKPKLKKVANKYNTQIFYADIDTFNEDDYEKFKTDFSFDGATPTTIFFKDGEEKTTATRIEGDVSIDKIVSKLKKNGFINE